MVEKSDKLNSQARRRGWEFTQLVDSQVKQENDKCTVGLRSDDIYPHVADEMIAGDVQPRRRFRVVFGLSIQRVADSR